MKIKRPPSLKRYKKGKRLKKPVSIAKKNISKNMIIHNRRKTNEHKKTDKDIIIFEGE